MSAILTGFSINTAGSPRRLAQRDTENYWRGLIALGGTDINANDQVQHVQNFLSGAYDVVPSTSFVGWSFRSGQNAGTGSIALSMGGGGNYRCTLINGPSWASDGFLTPLNDGTAGGVALPALYPRSLMLFADFNITGNGSGVTTLIGHANSGNLTINGNRAISLRGSGISNVGLAGLTIGTEKLQATAVLQSASQQIFKSGTSASQTQTLSDTTAINRAFASPTLSGVTGTVRYPFSAVIYQALDAAKINALRAVWNQTLGSGLGYPS